MGEQALILSRRLFEEVFLPDLRQKYPFWLKRIAAGLVGNGSECFGYDDDISQDHDWGADFYLWLTAGDYADIGEELAGWHGALLNAQTTFPLRVCSPYGEKIGIMRVDDFYTKIIGFPKGPQTLTDWLRIPEENLAMAVNGEVFYDGPGEFSSVREYLGRGYPEDIRLKKIAADCMAIAQTGQYNLNRCHQRGDIVTARIVLARFLSAAGSLALHLEGRFAPYYKWLYRMVTELPDIGRALGAACTEIAGSDDPTRQQLQAEKICALLQAAIIRNGLSDDKDSFFTYHAENVRAHIKDPFLKSLPTQYV